MFQNFREIFKYFKVKYFIVHGASLALFLAKYRGVKLTRVRV